jgi:hypothetical protein
MWSNYSSTDCGTNETELMMFDIYLFVSMAAVFAYGIYEFISMGNES